MMKLKPILIGAGVLVVAGGGVAGYALTRPEVKLARVAQTVTAAKQFDYKVSELVVSGKDVLNDYNIGLEGHVSQNGGLSSIAAKLSSGFINFEGDVLVDAKTQRLYVSPKFTSILTSFMGLDLPQGYGYLDLKDLVDASDASTSKDESASAMPKFSTTESLKLLKTLDPQVDGDTYTLTLDKDKYLALRNQAIDFADDGAEKDAVEENMPKDAFKAGDEVAVKMVKKSDDYNIDVTSEFSGTKVVVGVDLDNLSTKEDKALQLPEDSYDLKDELGTLGNQLGDLGGVL
jgi:hypothetical protein